MASTAPGSRTPTSCRSRARFTPVLGERPHQKDRLREDVRSRPAQLLDVAIPGGVGHAAGVRANVTSACATCSRGSRPRRGRDPQADGGRRHRRDLARASSGSGGRHAVALADGSVVDADLYRALRDELVPGLGEGGPEAALVLDGLVLSDEFAEFLTLPAYHLLG